MSTIINKMFRVIPKKQKISEINCHSICTYLADTGGELWEKVIYFINEEENCLDIKYKSRKGRGELGIEDKPKDFDVWIIENYEGGTDFISCLNAREYELSTSVSTNLYCFDEIRIKGKHNLLIEDFYPHFFSFKGKAPFYLEKALQKENGQLISLPLNGIYTAGTIYDVGDEFSRVPELVTKEEFFRPRIVSYWEAEFLGIHNANNYGTKQLLHSCIDDKFSNFDWDRSNLFEVQFCYKNRVVKKVETAKHWKYYNAEFFDNTIEKNWVDYGALWRRGLL